jgi:hypothetical protein
MKKILKFVYGLFAFVAVGLGVNELFYTDEWVFYIGRISLVIGLGWTFICLLIIIIIKSFEPEISNEKIFTLEFKSLLSIAAILAIIGAILELKPH